MDNPKVARPTTPAVAAAIDALREALRAEYGSDYSFIVTCRGWTLSASTMIQGDIRPIVAEVSRG